MHGTELERNYANTDAQSQGKWTGSWYTAQSRIKALKYFYIPFQGGASFVDHLCYFCLVVLCFHARLFVDTLWSPAGKGLTSWLSFVMSTCDVVTFALVSWVRCGAWLYRSLIFALFLTLIETLLCSMWRLRNMAKCWKWKTTSSC